MEKRNAKSGNTDQSRLTVKDELDDTALEQVSGGISLAQVVPVPHHNPPNLVDTVGGNPHFGWNLALNKKV